MRRCVMEWMKSKRARLTGWCVCGFVAGVIINLLVHAVANINKKIEWNGGVYYGETADGMPHGDGRWVKDGTTYSGQWTNGELTSGRVETKRLVYEGGLTDFKFNGYGVCKYKNGGAYWGYWKNDYKHGLGKMVDNDGRLTFGFFEKGEKTTAKDQQYTTGERVYGIDVSKHQGVIEWQDLYLSCNKNGVVDGQMVKPVRYVQPVLFAIAKSTEGSDIADSRFEGNYSEAKRCGIICGAYHFLTMMSSGKQQARNFIRNTQLSEDDFPPVLDIEKVTVNGKLQTDKEFVKIIPIAKEWLSTVEQHYKKKPVIYTNMKVYSTFIKPDDVLSKYDVWLAFHDKESLNVKKCIMSQFTHSGKANGISDNDVDLNVFYGNYDDLREYVSK